MKSAKLALALIAIPAAMAATSLTGCGSEPSTPVQQKQLMNDSGTTVKDLMLADSTLEAKVKSAAGYAVFPDVGRGALGVEVVSGNGDVYQAGKYIGTAHVGMVGAGLAVGGDSYSELILFETPEAMMDFENNKVHFAADASATALKAGAASTARYANGVLVFTHSKGGLIASAVIGGQQFTFKAANPQPATMP